MEQDKTGPGRRLTSPDDNYWTRRALTRRRLIGAGAMTSVGAAALALVGCGDDDDEDTGGSPTAGTGTSGATTTSTATSSAGGDTDLERTVRIAIADAKGGLDPHTPGNYTTRYSPGLHFDSLFQYDDENRQLVALVGEFEWVDDNTALIHVQPGQKWHDGEPLTAHDVKFSIDRVGGIAPYNSNGTFETGGAYSVAAVTDPPEVVDDETVRLFLKTDATAPNLLTTFRIVPKHHVEAVGDEAFNRSGLGSGPYKLESYTPDAEVRSVRYDDYFLPFETRNRHKSWIKEVRQLVKPEALSRVAALETGEVDVVEGLAPELVAEFDGRDDYKLVFLPGNPHIIFPNTLVPMLPDGSNPFRDIRVRQAMNHAIDVETIISSLGSGREQRSYGYGSLQLGAIPPDKAKTLTMEFNPQKARALMDEAGYGDGFETDFYATSGFAALTEDVALTVQQYLSDIGIKTNLVLSPLSEFRPKFAAKDIPGLFYYFTNQSPDPAQVLNAEVAENGTLAVAVYPETGLQAKLTAQQTEFDPQKRAAILSALAEELYTNASWLFLFEPSTAGVMKSDLEWTLKNAELAAGSAWAIRPLKG